MTLRSIRFEALALGAGALLLILSSSTTEPQKLYAGQSVGDTLAEVKITNERQVATLPSGAEREGLMLVNFWAAYDAESRARNVAYSELLAGEQVEGLAYQAISLDVDQEVYEQTLAFDGVKSGEQILVDAAKRSQVLELCGQEVALHSYLIDKDGKILLVDPSPRELVQFVRN